MDFQKFLKFLKPPEQTTSKYPKLNYSLSEPKPDKRWLYESFYQTKRRDILIPGARVFLLDDLLTEDDCSNLISMSKRYGYGTVAWEYSEDYRKCERAVMMASKLAQGLWVRIQEQLTAHEILGIRPYGFDNSGNWVPVSVNECIRFTKYSPGDHFSPHKDGAFVLNDEIRSVFTIMIYLNDDFEGGETVFYDQLGGKQIQKVTPKIGRGLIFNHDIVHEGTQVSLGTKYILRTDLMYERKSQASERNLLLANSTFLRCDKLYKDSIEYQKNGDPKNSTKAYIQAQNIMTRYPSVTTSTVNTSTNISLGWDLDHDSTLNVFSYFDIKTLSRCSQVCKGWKIVSETSSLWRKLYSQQWPYAIKIESLVGFSTEVLDVIKSWKESYEIRKQVEKDFKIVYFDIGTLTSRFGMMGDPLPGNSITRPFDPPEIPSIVSRVKGHYWSAREGMEDYIVGFLDDRTYYSTYFPRRPFEKQSGKEYFLTSEQQTELSSRTYFSSWIDSFQFLNLPSVLPQVEVTVYWDVIRNIIKYIFSRGFGSYQNMTGHPILLALPPCFREAERYFLQYMLIHDLKVPYYYFISSDVLALLSVGKVTGLVISSGHIFTTITPVVDGTPLEEFQQSYKYSGIHLSAETNKNLSSDVEKYFFNEKTDDNIAVLAIKTLMNCPEDKRNSLLHCVLFVGGNTFSIENEFKKQFSTLCEKHHLIKPKFVVPEDRLTATIFGARIFSSLSTSRYLFNESKPMEGIPKLKKGEMFEGHF